MSLCTSKFCPAWLSILLVCTADAQTQSPPSLGDLARKERERKGASTSPGAKVLSNEEVQKAYQEDYPSVQARFAMPKGWEKPTPSRHIVIAPCPGTILPPAPFEPETVDCALAVGIDGPSRKSRENAVLALEGIRAEFLAKAKRQIEPWRMFELAGMPAGETVVEWDSSGPLRRMRVVVAIHPQTGLVYMVALLAIPGRFQESAPALDTVLATFEAVPKAPAPREN